jgi:hypothetical protein
MAVLSSYPLLVLHMKQCQFASACEVGARLLLDHRTHKLTESITYTGYCAITAAYGVHSMACFGTGQLEDAVAGATHAFRMVNHHQGTLAGMEGALWASATFILLGEWNLLLNAWDKDAAGLLAMKHISFQPHKGVLMVRECCCWVFFPYLCAYRVHIYAIPYALHYTTLHYAHTQMWYMTLDIIRLGLKQRDLKRQKTEAVLRQGQWERRKGSRLPCFGNSTANAQRREAYEDKLADLDAESRKVETELLENLTAIPEAEMQILKSPYPAPFLKYVMVFVAYHIADDYEDGLTAVEEWKRAVRVNAQEVLSQAAIYTAQGQLLHQAARRFAHTTKKDTVYNEHGKVCFRVEMVQETGSTLCHLIVMTCVCIASGCLSLHRYIYIYMYICIFMYPHIHPFQCDRFHGGRLLLRGAKQQGRCRKNQCRCIQGLQLRDPSCQRAQEHGYICVCVLVCQCVCVLGAIIPYYINKNNMCHACMCVVCACAGMAFRAQVLKCQMMFGPDRVLANALRGLDCSCSAKKKKNIAVLQELYDMIIGVEASLGECRCVCGVCVVSTSECLCSRVSPFVSLPHTHAADGVKIKQNHKILKQLSLVQVAEVILLTHEGHVRGSSDHKSLLRSIKKKKGSPPIFTAVKP